jgi:hypothetical protein
LAELKRTSIEMADNVVATFYYPPTGAMQVSAAELGETKLSKQGLDDDGRNKRTGKYANVALRLDHGVDVQYTILCSWLLTIDGMHAQARCGRLARTSSPR